MKKPDFKKSFTNNRFKYGASSALIAVVLIAALIVINLGVQKLNIKKDLTYDKLYSISKESIDIVKNIKNDTKIIIFTENGKEDANFKQILDRYKAASNKITLEFIDPKTNAAAIQKYSSSALEVVSNDIIVESGTKFKHLPYSDFFNVSVDANGQQTVDSFAAEQQITNAIVYVNSDKEQTIYTLSGHNEKSMGSQLLKQLNAENYVIQDLDLLKADAKLSEGSILAIVSPRVDITKDESSKIKEFIDKGGRAVFLMDITKDILPNFQELLSSYGVKLQNSLIIEGNTEYMGNQAVDLLPVMEAHEIVNPLKANKMPVYMPVSQGIDEIKDKKDTITIEKLLTSSDNSWGKINLNADTISKEKGDINGPIDIAVAVSSEDKSTGKTGKLILVGNASFVDDDVNSAVRGTNVDFAMNSFNWLQDKKDSITIRPKSLTSLALNMNMLQRLSWSGVVVIFIPLIVLAAGIIVWVRRRHR